MGSDIRRPDNSVLPPRWADALLRAFLKPEEAEIASGDLLEAYRDSIHPVRGSTRANFWYVQQVAGYILRTGEVKLRNCQYSSGHVYE
jgi:hypothetical protein